MDEKVTYWASLGLSVLALLLLISNIALISGNRNLQSELAQRQTAINNGVTLSQINQSLVQALADASVKNDDKSIRDLLAAQGITVKAGAKAEAVKVEDKSETKKK